MPMHAGRRAGTREAVIWIDTDSSGVIVNWVCKDDEVAQLLGGGADPEQERWRLHRVKRFLSGFEFDRISEELTDEF